MGEGEASTESQAPKKTDPITSARLALISLVGVFLVIGLLAFVIARQDENGVLYLNIIGALLAFTGVCFLLNADLISIWRREDDAADRVSKPSELEVGFIKRRWHAAKLTFGFQARDGAGRSARRAGESKEDWKKRLDVEEEARQHRREQVELEAAAKEQWLLRGHFCVVIAAMFVAIGYLLPFVSESSDSETNVPEECPTESSEPGDTSTGP